MSPSTTAKRGPLTQAILNAASWSAGSCFPASQNWANEFEQVLSFLEAQGVLDQFFPRLTTREWEGALAEARAAFFFHRNGFQILNWHPLAVPSRPGDLEIQWQNSNPIFIEVKRPGWEGELSAEEIAAGRQHSDKYIHAEPRWIDSLSRVVYAMQKALPKLNPTRCNLVVVVDDLFESPTEMPRDLLAESLDHEFQDPKFQPIGGLFILNPVSYGGPVEYQKYFAPNLNACTTLPQPVLEGFISGNADPQGPHWSRVA